MTTSLISTNIAATRLTYTATSLSDGGHYGIHFKAKFLFIDSWTSKQSIIFRADSNDVYSYNYLM